MCSANNLLANLSPLGFRVFFVFCCLFGGIKWNAELLNLNVTSITDTSVSVLRRAEQKLIVKLMQ